MKSSPTDNIHIHTLIILFACSGQHFITMAPTPPRFYLSNTHTKNITAGHREVQDKVHHKETTQQTLMITCYI